MTPKDIKSLIKTLRAAGVTHYKTPELELELGGSIQGDMRLPVKQEEVGSIPTRPATVSHETNETEEDKPIDHTEVMLTSLRKISDVDLLDMLYPDHTKEYKEAEDTATDTN